jgi:hypothetical protein
VKGALAYAQTHGGKFPGSVEDLLDAKLVTPDEVHSPFGNGEAITMQEKVKKNEITAEKFAEWYAKHSDYGYYGADYTLKKIAAATQPAASGPATGPARRVDLSHVIIAASTDVIMSSKMSAGFLDGHAEYIGLEAAEQALKDTNAARAAMGLPELRPPGSIERAREAERADRATGGR